MQRNWFRRLGGKRAVCLIIAGHRYYGNQRRHRHPANRRFSPLTDRKMMERRLQSDCVRRHF
jgi:hypothetical protein